MTRQIFLQYIRNDDHIETLSLFLSLFAINRGPNAIAKSLQMPLKTVNSHRLKFPETYGGDSGKVWGNIVNGGE